MVVVVTGIAQYSTTICCEAMLSRSVTNDHRTGVKIQRENYTILTSLSTVPVSKMATLSGKASNIEQYLI